jgi:hypothetical protein
MDSASAPCSSTMAIAVVIIRSTGIGGRPRERAGDEVVATAPV